VSGQIVDAFASRGMKRERRRDAYPVKKFVKGKEGCTILKTRIRVSQILAHVSAKMVMMILTAKSVKRWNARPILQMLPISVVRVRKIEN